jgi:excisionase family DNA binding protein
MGEDRTRDRLGDRITTAEAARRLGITEGAVRKRAQRGKIRHERDGDGRLWVWLSSDETRRDSPRDGPGQSRDTSQLVEELRGRVAFLEAELKIRTEENRRKDHLLAAALERIPAIEAPQESPDPSEKPPEPVPSTETPLERETPAEPRPWWRRVFGG